MIPKNSANPPCVLCQPEKEDIVWEGAEYRVISVETGDYPGYCRVIWNRHVAEMTDLQPQQQAMLMAGVFATESALREVLRPDKINLASLGNQVPHLHWHVIPRFHDDPAFPDAIWAPPRRHPPQRNWNRARLAAALSLHLGKRAR